MSTRIRYAVAGLAACAGIAFGWYLLASHPAGADFRRINVGIYENSPKVYTDADGNPAGLFVELIGEIAHKEDWRLHFVHCTWAACLQQVAEGKIDLMPDVAYSRERSRRFDFPELPVTYSWSQVYRNSNTAIHTIADLAHRKVAVLRDSIQQRYLAQLMAGSHLQYQPYPVDTYSAGFEAVHEGRADAVVSNPFFGGRHAAAYGLIQTPIIFEPVSLYFATGKGRNDELLNTIDRYLARWREDPDSIYFAALRHAMAPPPAIVLPTWLRLGLYGGVATVMLLLMFSMLLRWQVRRATAELNRANDHLDDVLAASPVVLYQLRREEDALIPEWVSPNIERLFGFTAVQALEPGWWESRLHPLDRERVLNQVREVLAEGRIAQDYRIVDAQGTTRYIRDELRAQTPAPDGIYRFIGTWSDLTEARSQAAQVDYLTKYDPLTGLANRGLLRSRLSAAIERARPDSGRIAVLCIDLDRFKNINDTLGHSEGDKMLCSVAVRLQGFARPSDMVARVGGDEFIVLLGDDPSARRASEFAQQLLDLFADPIHVGKHALVVTASIGIGLFPADGNDADTLLKHAELALYEAKSVGRGTYRFFASELSSGALERLVMENALRGAAYRNELTLHYQPQIDLRSGSLVGVEALVRWKHPELGLVSPGNFIPLAEETGIIKEIGAWVLNEACRQMCEWRSSGFLVPSVAVNLSAQQIEVGSLSNDVIKVLRATGLEARHLELEITESTIMRRPDEAVDALSELKQLGVLLSIDDFGTGHSSLAYLKRLPLDRLKIDQSFVRDIGHDPNDEAISRTVIDLARSLNLGTVAEGVEREEQADFLRAEGCEFAQGYLFSRPLPADELRQGWEHAVGADRDDPATVHRDGERTDPD